MSDMTIILSHISALEYWRTSQRLPCSHAEIAYAKKLITRTPQLRKASLLDELKVARPFHVLVSDEKFRKRNNLLVSHTWKNPLHKGSAMLVEEDIFVVSPELCFLQLAGTSPLIELIEVGFELCGRYNNTGRPLITVASLKTFIVRHKGTHGANKAMRALSYIVDNSASHMETKLTMLLCLPFKLGGYNFREPVLNEHINKIKRDGSTLGDYFVADLLWQEQRIILEYDSTEYHDNDRSHLSDSVRRTELIGLGYDVVSVVSSQVTTAMGTKNLASSLAKKMGRKLRIPKSEFLKANMELRKVLFKRSFY